MIFATSLPRFKAFLGENTCKATDLANALLLITPFLLPTARRSVAAAARSVLDDARDAGWLLRWLGSSDAPAALLAAAQHRLLADAASAGGLHVLAIDSTQHGTQGQNAENTFCRGNTRQRPKKSDRRQRPVHRRSCHCFVFALLLTPAGLRIPYWLPFYTEQFCATFGRRHLSQASLAAQLIDAVPLPAGSRVVVVGDTAFEAKQVRQACARRGWSWVVPVNPERRLAGPAPRPQVRELYTQLTSHDFRQVSFRLDRGEWAELARVSPKRSQSGKHQRAYWAHHRTAAVHNVGPVALLFSTTVDPTTPGGVVVQKVLMSDAVTASAEELLGWYALRWQVELFFKEMKSELGMCQYKLGPFARVAGWVDLSLVAFCYLEWYRWQRQQEGGGQEERWRRQRTAGLREEVRRQAQRADIESLLRLAGSGGGRRRLQCLLDRICADPAATAA